VSRSETPDPAACPERRLANILVLPYKKDAPLKRS
jgi:hypothetical protein